MANRHHLRTIVMQSLYEWEFHPKADLVEIANRQVHASGGGDDDTGYLGQTVAGLKKQQPAIDKLIVKRAPEWPLEQIAAIDRAILRLGIYEVLFSDEVPPKVAINEAVEIAKMYGGESSGSFVNGVLGTIYRASDKYDPSEDIEKATAKKVKTDKSNEKK